MCDIQRCVGCKDVHGGEYDVDLLLGGLLGELVVPARAHNGHIGGLQNVLIEHKARLEPHQQATLGFSQ